MTSQDLRDQVAPGFAGYTATPKADTPTIDVPKLVYIAHAKNESISATELISVRSVKEALELPLDKKPWTVIQYLYDIDKAVTVLMIAPGWPTLSLALASRGMELKDFADGGQATVIFAFHEMPRPQEVLDTVDFLDKFDLKYAKVLLQATQDTEA